MYNPLNASANQLICCANQLTGFYMRATKAFNELIFKDKKTLRVMTVFCTRSTVLEGLIRGI